MISFIRTIKEKGREVYIVLDPDPPTETTTFLDLYYDQDLRNQLINHLSTIIDSLLELGIEGVVLGDEWPRGLSRDEVTVELLAVHNETYHQETGFWMRPDPTVGDKILLAEWFYEHSIEAQNLIAHTMRQKYPDLYLGTNIDLIWEPDLKGSNIAHWKASHWWMMIDTTPYDFLVTHSYTKVQHIPGNSSLPKPTDTDQTRISELEEALSLFLGPSDNPLWDLDIYLLLAAHCVYPYVTTPMQMIEEWNLATSYSDRLAAVGWFIFDIWPSQEGWLESTPISDTSIQVPMKIDRLLTLGELLEGC